MKNLAKKILEKNKCRGTTLVLAVSGGPDSMCLMHLLADLAMQLNLRLIVAHLNHSLRGKESDADEKFVVNQAKKLGLKIETKKINVAKFSKIHKLNLEEAARIKRYEFLESVRKKHNARQIVLAHNLNDNAETILMNFIRGAGLAGIAGMAEDSGNLLRPLLQFSKKEILLYCRKNKILFRIDKSNLNTNLRRNFLRRVLIPKIEKLNPNFTKAISRKGAYYGQAHEFLKNLAENWIKKNCRTTGSRIICAAKKLRDKDDFFKKLIIEKIYEIFNKTTRDLESIHIEEILSIINKNTGNKQKQIGNRIAVKLLRGKIIFYKP